MAALAARPAIASIRFVNPPVSLLVSPQRLWAEFRTDRRYRWGGWRPFCPLPNLAVQTPILFLPFRGRFPLLARADRSLQRARLLGPLAKRPFVLYVNGIREETAELIRLVRPLAAFQVFDWSDDFAEFPRDPAVRERIRAITVQEIRHADLVLAVNESLAARARAAGARGVETVINATGLRPPAAGAPVTPGARALRARLRRPVLGYAGFINEHRIDAELVRELARRHPDWTILFLGLVQLDFDRQFHDLPNVVFHPLVRHSELADYLAVFDVCLIPHLDNAHTAGNNPLKLYDYLTTGRSIVSTPIAGLSGFEDVVDVARDHAGARPRPPPASAAGRSTRGRRAPLRSRSRSAARSPRRGPGPIPSPLESRPPAADNP